MTWFGIMRCSSCKKILSQDQFILSHCCPFCGVIPEHGCLDVEKGRCRITSPWWRFWNVTREVEWKETENHAD